jgi:hypothetical protein
VQSQRRVAKGPGAHSGNADVDRHRLHVQAVEGNTVPVFPEELIAPRRAITADDVDLGVGSAYFCTQVVQEIENSRVNVMDIAGSVVAQEMVKLIKRVG